MNLPDYNNPILRLQRRIKELEATVARHGAKGRPTFPIYSPQNLADFVEQNEGEYYINSSDGFLYYIFNGKPQKVTST